jgi:hypothetical protein
VDAQTSELTTLPVDSTPDYLVASEDAVWVVGSSDVYRIDGAGLTVGKEPIPRSGGEPFSLLGGSLAGPATVADGSLWVLAPSGESDSLIEIDLVTQSIRDEYPADIGSADGYDPWMAAVGDAIWIYRDQADDSIRPAHARLHRYGRRP